MRNDDELATVTTTTMAAIVTGPLCTKRYTMRPQTMTCISFWMVHTFLVGCLPSLSFTRSIFGIVCNVTGGKCFVSCKYLKWIFQISFAKSIVLPVLCRSATTSTFYSFTEQATMPRQFQPKQLSIASNIMCSKRLYTIYMMYNVCVCVYNNNVERYIVEFKTILYLHNRI